MASLQTSPLIAPGADLDPAVLAFMKCHVTSTLKWDALRLMAEREGQWVGAEDIARAVRRSRADVERAMRMLAREDVIEELRSGDPDDTSFRLPRLEPSTLVLQRLVQTSRRSLELRALLAAHLYRAERAISKAA